MAVKPLIEILQEAIKTIERGGSISKEWFSAINEWCQEKHFLDYEKYFLLPFYKDLIHVCTKDGFFYALDEKTGEEKWTNTTGKKPRIACSEDTIFINSNSLSALDAFNGQEKFKLPGSFSYMPVLNLHGSLIYLYSQGNFQVIDSKTGLKKWSFKTDFIRNLPRFHKNLVYITSEKALHALDRETGEERWNFKTERFFPVGLGNVVDENNIYFVEFNGNVCSLDAKTGRKKWNNNTRQIINSALNYYKGLLIFSTCDLEVYAIDAKTGKQRWCFPNRAVSGKTPIIYYDNVYFGSDNQLKCLDALTGKEKWHFRTNSYINIAVTAYDGFVYFGRDKLYCVDAKTGEERWRTGSNILSSPAVRSNTVYFGTERYIHAVNALDAKPIWTADSTEICAKRSIKTILDFTEDLKQK